MSEAVTPAQPWMGDREMWHIGLRLPAAALAAALMALCTLSSPAQAQYPCSGPGPGEVVVGQTPGSQAHAPMLLCQYVGGDEGAGDEPSRPWTPPVEIQPSYMAAATHIDTSAYWVSRAHWTAEAANKRVLDACTAAMGAGCVISDTIYGYGPMGIIIDAMGLRWIKSGGDVPKDSPLEVRYRDLAMLCHTNSFGCEFEGYLYQGALPKNGNPDTDYADELFPKGPVERHHWALVARPGTAPSAAWQNKSWLSSGKQDSAAARQELLDRCRADSGVPCAIAAYAANGVLVHFVNGKGQSGWTSAVPDAAKKKDKKKQAAMDRTSVAARVERLCLPSVKPCRVIATFDAATPLLSVIADPQ